MRRTRAAPLAVALLVITGAVIATRVDGFVSFPSAAASPRVSPGLQLALRRLVVPRPASPSAASTKPSAHGVHIGRIGAADGALPDGVTVFEEHLPGVANLDGDLLAALREAAKDAARAGIELNVNSGWRSHDYQEQLLREAIARYGSRKEAARWVATPDTSAHVSGNAVDIGPVRASTWLSAHGGVYGLCQIYRNEPWHFELRPLANEPGCPPMYADSAHDPTIAR